MLIRWLLFVNLVNTFHSFSFDNIPTFNPHSYFLQPSYVLCTLTGCQQSILSCFEWLKVGINKILKHQIIETFYTKELDSNQVSSSWLCQLPTLLYCSFIYLLETCIVYIHVRWLAVFFAPAFDWCIATFLQTLLPPVNLWNSTTPLEGIFIPSPAFTRYKQNVDPLIKISPECCKVSKPPQGTFK